MTATAAYQRELDYRANSELVVQTTLKLQPPCGLDYSPRSLQIQRERIAVNVHQGRDPMEGV